MTNPTSNYSWVLPNSADLVTDLPADFDVALQGVDTRLKALQPGTTLGDLAYSSATANTNTRLGIGTSGQVLAVSGGGVPAWTTTADVTPLTTKGDLFTFTTVDARIGVGANNTILTADSAEATGLKWATPATPASWTTIASGSLSGTTVSVTGIAGTYKNLKIILRNPSHSARNPIGIRYNSSTASTYGSGGSYISDASAFANGGAGYGQNFMYLGNNNWETGATNYGYYEMDLTDYADTSHYKVGSAKFYALDSAPSSPFYFGTQVTLWRNTAAINEINFFAFGVLTFTAGTYLILGQN